MHMAMRLDAINRLDKEAFVALLGGVFEHSPWVAERSWASRPFASLRALHEAMCFAMRQAPATQQIRLIRAHPELASRARMSPESLQEQRGAGLDRLTPKEYERFQRLGRLYREKFGFPFILAVKGKDKNDILQALESRLPNDRETEFENALSQIERIAWFRLEALVEE
jgi:2-oxo-4-hydroxy-4-carboxy-5-ureidoimidazoline decarboxylase